jgi:hypothetical protein
MYASKTGFVVKDINYQQSNILQTLLYFTNNFRTKKIAFSEKNFSQNRFLQIMATPIVFLLGLLKLGDEIEVILEKSQWLKSK